VDDTYRITFDITVTNEDRLIEYASQRYQECWGNEISTNVLGGETIVQRSLLEALLFSNENPSPDEYGIEFPGFVEITPI
jgi:hypothetical protein